MILRRIFKVCLLAGAILSSIYLPSAVESWLVAILAFLVLFIFLIIGWQVKIWLPTFLIGTFLIFTDFFGLIRDQPNLLWLIILILWIMSTWLILYIGAENRSLFSQALASFLVVEIFLTLHLWPINIISKAVIIVAFTFFLWHELTRNVSIYERIQESMIPFALIVTLMVLTGQWLSF